MSKGYSITLPMDPAREPKTMSLMASAVWEGGVLLLFELEGGGKVELPPPNARVGRLGSGIEGMAAAIVGC